MFSSYPIRFAVGLQIILVVVAAQLELSAGQGCKPVEVKGDRKKLICTCNEHYCDEFEKFDWPQVSGEAILIRSTESGLRFERSKLQGHLATSSSSHNKTRDQNNNKLQIDLSTRHQPILGWGGSFTDAAVLNFANLSTQLADKLLENYYGEMGLEYNFGRVPIAGSDFSTRAYSYADSKDPDYGLEAWSLAPEDLEYKIPFIQKANKIARLAGRDVKLIASPWSPPKWMKTNHNFVRGKLIDEERVYKSYTEYLMKFYDAYLKNGIRFWGATVQNEPVVSNLPVYFFNSLQFNTRQQIKFIAEYLGPAMEARNFTKENFKLMVGDDSLGAINLQVPTILSDKRVQKYVSGLAFHWYLSGTFVSYDALNQVVDEIKDKIEFVIMTEACTGSEPIQKKVDLGSWDRGESYATDIIEDLLRHTGAWIDWNMALNQQGGPNWAGNMVDSPIIVNGAKNEFYKQPMYYALAHFTRFFKPGSVRVDTKLRTSPSLSPGRLMSVAVYNENSGHLIVNILNKSDTKKKVDISIDGLVENSAHERTLQTLTVAGKSINTIVLKI